MVAKCVPIALLALLMLAQPLFAGKILGYFITPSRSHFIIEDSLMRGLAAKGHDVTVVSFFPPPPKPIPNYTSIQLEMSNDTKVDWEEFSENLLDGAQKKEIFMLRMPQLLKVLLKMNRESYTHPLVEKLRREDSFDLVVFGWFFNDFQLGLSEHFKCPAVLVATMNAVKPMLDYVGNPMGVAHTPLAGSAMVSPMNFPNRVINFVGSVAMTAIFRALHFFVLEPEYRYNFPPDRYPSFEVARKNVALVLVTSHMSQYGPTALFPSIIEVGGMQTKKHADPLPENIQHWLDNAEHGAVFFSLGTNIRSNQLPPAKLAEILRVLGRLKQRVLWKWEDDDLPGKPNNVMVQKWLPQNDVLAHPNVKLFISHCGKGGVSEARYHGVPILGIPVFADQPENLAAIVDEGWAVPLQYSELTEETFKTALTEALTNPRYGEVVQKKADLYRDRPQHPLDTAVFWTEYVMRHKGAKHMQSQAVDLNWFQYYSVDVIGTLLIAFYVIFKLSAFVWRRLWRLVFGVKSTQKKNASRKHVKKH